MTAGGAPFGDHRVEASRAPAGVAVIIAARDAEATIARAVASALGEPQVHEVIVVDDASRDHTAMRATQADDGTGRLRIVSLPQNVGPAEARNIGIGLSSAAWACPLDSDDFFLPGRVGRVLALAEGCDLIADDLLRVREGDEGGPHEPLIGDQERLPTWLGFSRFVTANISRPRRPRREYGFLKPLMRRAFLDAHGLRYDPSLRLGEDFILYAQALARGAAFKLVEPCGYVAVIRQNSLSAEHSTEDLEALLEASMGLSDLPGLAPAEREAARLLVRHLRDRVALRQILDAKRAHGPFRAAALLARKIDSGIYVFCRFIIDKTATVRRRTSAPR